MKALLGFAVLTIGLLAFHPAPAAAEPSLATVQASYAKLEHVKAAFTQTTVNATYGVTKARHGKLYLARPDKMRWDYSDKKQDHSFIYDGTVLWFVDPAGKKVIKYKTDQQMMPVAFAFLRGGDLSKEFDVAASGDTLVLAPKSTNAAVKTLTLVIDAKTNRVVKSIVRNHQDDTNEFVLANLDEATAPDAKIFEFSPKRVPLYKVEEYK